MTNELAQWDQANEEASAGTVTTAELDELARKREEAWAKYEEVKAIASELYRQAEECEDKFVLALERAGKQKYAVDGIGTYSFTSRMSVQTPKTIEEKQALARFLESMGGKTLFWSTFSIHSATLNSFYQEAFEEYQKKCEETGSTEPFHVPGLQPPTAKKSLRLTKEKTKGKANE